MKLRDILILTGLVGLILVLTVAEQYAERRRELRRDAQRAAELQAWQKGVAAALESRWENLSADLRATLDSMAAVVIAGGVSEDSLAAVVLDTEEGVPQAEGESHGEAAEPRVNPAADLASADSLADEVARAYDAALAALPTDLNAYEERVAANEVVSLIRARFGLTQPRFDSLLMRASQRP